jgi:hypothetical protein
MGALIECLQVLQVLATEAQGRTGTPDANLIQAFDCGRDMGQLLAARLIP